MGTFLRIVAGSALSAYGLGLNGMTCGRHKDVTVVTDDYLLDDLERSQLNKTRRRRSKRSRRYYQMLLLAVAFLALAVLAAPSLLSHSGAAQSMLASNARAYGWDASAESIHVGWITPLSIQGLKLVGESGETTVQIERADTALTVTDLIRFDSSAVGEVSLRGVAMQCTVSPGSSSIETDLEKLLQPSDQPTSIVRASVQIQDVSATISDRVTGQAWTLNQSNLNVAIDGQQLKGDIAGLVNEPSGSGGAIQSQFEWNPAAVGESNASVWELAIDTDSFPLSVTNLLSRRFSGQVEGLQHFSGDTTGHLLLVGANDGAVRATLGDFKIRNLHAIAGDDPEASENASAQKWNNELATLDGQFALTGGAIFGEGLEITTDFASATLDGSFPTTISLVGSKDNPLSWLQSLNGRAQVDVDLAALDRALPGLIPLRRNAALVSGRARGTIENTPPGDNQDPNARRSNLTIASDSVRARSQGRVVVIEPIKLTATVTDQNGVLSADHFDLTSAFAEASGKGTLENGTAEVDIDFGRLYAMLRPVIDLSDLSLGGTAAGEVHWSVKRATNQSTDSWELGGAGEAKNLLVTLPNGHRFKRAIVQGDVSAQGQWNGRTLQQLTSADIGIRSGGVSLRAELTSPVQHPTADTMYPIHVQTDGRLENLNESLRPWLPQALLAAEGRLTGSATAKVSRSGGSLARADFVLSQPRINYDSRWYSQKSLKIGFEGVLDWPSGNFAPQEMTAVGESISLRVRGEASRENTNLDVAWQADLEGLQKSVGSTIARAASAKIVRPISYRPVRSEAFRVGGKCNGKLTITGGPDDWRIETSTTGNDLKIYQPNDGRNVPPGTIPGTFAPSNQATFGHSFGRAAANALGDPVWQEPRLQIVGPVKFNSQTGAIQLAGMQVSSDWFAGTLSGEVTAQDGKLSASLSGPTRWNMEVVAGRLSELLETDIAATGIHEGPIEIALSSTASRPFAFGVKGDLGWDQCEVQGMRFGAAKLPYEVTEQKIKLAKSSVPIIATESDVSGRGAQAGTVTFGADVLYASNPMRIAVQPGAKVESLRITPSTAAGWLKYLAPLAANATSLDGAISAELDEANIVVDDPAQSVVRGRLEVQSMRLSSGPLANQLIQGVQQIKSLARLTGGNVEASAAKTLIEMPPQTVEFTFQDSVATHQRMFFQIDRANLMTSGRVSMDSQIDMVALVPLDARWLGSDLQGLAGQTLTFPITGTLSRPRLDDSAVRNVMAELGTKAGAEVIQNRLDGVIQKQLGTGMDQINSGLEKILGF